MLNWSAYCGSIWSKSTISTRSAAGGRGGGPADAAPTAGLSGTASTARAAPAARSPDLRMMFSSPGGSLGLVGKAHHCQITVWCLWPTHTIDRLHARRHRTQTASADSGPERVGVVDGDVALSAPSGSPPLPARGSRRRTAPVRT